MKRVAIYIRVSTSKQDTDNQRRERAAVSKKIRLGVVKVFEDAGISGAKGRDQRPGLDAMMKAMSAKEFVMVASISMSSSMRSSPSWRWALAYFRPPSASASIRAVSSPARRVLRQSKESGRTWRHSLVRCFWLPGFHGYLQVACSDEMPPRSASPRRQLAEFLLRVSAKKRRVSR